MTHSRFAGFEAASCRASGAMAGRTRRRAGGRPGELEFYPRDAVDDDFVDRFGIVGPPERCAERLRELTDLGIERIYIGTRAVGVDLEERNTHRLGREVLPLLRQAPVP